MMPYSILSLISVLLILGCRQNTSQNIKTGNNKITAVIATGEGYQLDTAVITTNKNLPYLLKELRKQPLNELRNYKVIPQFIKQFLNTLTNGFSNASHGEVWRVGCTTPFEVDSSITLVKSIDPKTGETTFTQSGYFRNDAPLRLLTYFGIGDGIALMKYYTGGWAKMEHILIFKFTNTMSLIFGREMETSLRMMQLNWK